jgi:hypothetical protein
MKLITEYLELAAKFDGLAASEKNPEFKAQLAKQAQAYRNLAVERAKKIGVSAPEFPRNDGPN